MLRPTRPCAFHGRNLTLDRRYCSGMSLRVDAGNSKMRVGVTVDVQFLHPPFPVCCLGVVRTHSEENREREFFRGCGAGAVLGTRRSRGGFERGIRTEDQRGKQERTS